MIPGVNHEIIDSVKEVVVKKTETYMCCSWVPRNNIQLLGVDVVAILDYISGYC
jgi:hypothetical protein